MGQSPLVSDEIDAWAKFLSRLDQAGRLPVAAAFWLKKDEDSLWYLYVASEKIDGNSILEDYGEVLRVAGELHGDPNIDPLRVKLIGVDHPLAKGVIELQSRYTPGISFRFHGYELGGMGVEDAYIYGLPIPVPG
jgi:hypothetical protein